MISAIHRTKYSHLPLKSVTLSFCSPCSSDKASVMAAQQLRVNAMIAEEDAIMRMIIANDIEESEEFMLDNDPLFIGWSDEVLKENQEALIKQLQGTIRKQVIIQDKLRRISIARMRLQSSAPAVDDSETGSIATEEFVVIEPKAAVVTGERAHKVPPPVLTSASHTDQSVPLVKSSHETAPKGPGVIVKMDSSGRDHRSRRRQK